MDIQKLKYPNGVHQTGYSFPNGTSGSYTKDVSVIEFIGANLPTDLGCINIKK